MTPVTDSESMVVRDSPCVTVTGQTMGTPAAETRSREACEQLFLAHLRMIDGLVSAVARQHRLSADEAEDFRSVARLRIISDDYAILRKFQARCTLRTFLTVVTQRLFLDYRAAMWGKWRPSVKSRREGDVAVLLERLTMRDGLTFDEACTVLETNHGLRVERDTLERIYAGFRIRSRPRFVSDEQLGDVPDRQIRADQVVLGADSSRLTARASAALATSLARLPEQDQLILKLRFSNGMSVADISRTLRLDQKALYRGLDRLMRQLRAGLEAEGVAGSELLEALGHSDVQVTEAFKANESDSSRQSDAAQSAGV